MTAVDLDLTVDDLADDKQEHAFCRSCNIIEPGQLATAICGYQKTVPSINHVYVLDMSSDKVCAACIVRWPTHNCTA